MSDKKYLDENRNSESALRDAAEEKLDKSPTQPFDLQGKTPEEIIHELRVHQIELEIQNEELKRTHLELEESRDKYQDLYDFAPVGYFTLTRKGIIREVNLTGASLIGMPRPKLTEMRFGRFVAPESEDRYYQHIISVLNQAEKKSCVLTLKRDDGSFFLCCLESIRMDTLVEPEGGGNGGHVIRTVITDITERKRIEDALRVMEIKVLHAQKLESLVAMAGGIAHDFNNQLAVVLGNLEFALMDLTPGSAARPSIENAVAAATRSAELSRKMQIYTGNAMYYPVELNLDELLNKKSSQLKLCVSKHITVDLENHDTLPLIKGNADQIQCLVIDILVNASEAIGENAGNVTLRTGVMDCDEACLSHSRLEKKPEPGRFVFLEFRDTGCGMGAETLHRLFDPFFTTKFTGRGLGMAEVWGIVMSHNGAITVESEVGKGTTIRVLFPVSKTVNAPEE